VGQGEQAAIAEAGHDGMCEVGLVRAFDFLGKRWNGVILGSLSSQPAGFAELRRGVGAITDSVLSDRLTELAAGGLIERTVTDARPPGVTYALTAAGAALLPILHQLATWAVENLPESCEPVE
jgi:DNA-binding HxlR family transcriptional regulator